MEFLSVCYEYVLFPLVNTKKNCFGPMAAHNRTRGEFQAAKEEKKKAE